MRNRNGKITIILISISIVVVLVMCYFLFFSKSEDKGNNYPKVDIYKYEVSSDNFKYFLNKMDANKIGLDKVITYKCVAKECAPAKSLLSDGNIYDETVLIQDGKQFLIYNFAKKKKTVVTNITDYSYADFINDGKYVLISNDESYYVYDIDNDKISNQFKADIISLRDGRLTIVNEDNIITSYNNKYGMINIKSGNNSYDNEYEYIDCIKNVCLFSKDGITTVYDLNNKDNSLLIPRAEEILFYDDSFIVYGLNNTYHLYSISSGEDSEIKLEKSNVVYSVSKTDKDVIVNYGPGKCYNYYLSNGSAEQVACKNIHVTDIIANAPNKTNLTIAYGNNKKNTYDLKVDGNKMYSNDGKYYDYVSIESEAETPVKGEIRLQLELKDAYSFLNTISTSLELSKYEELVFYNKWMPVFYKYGSSYVEVDVNEDKDTILDVQILSKYEDYRNISIVVRKENTSYNEKVTNLNMKPIDRSEFNVVTFSGISY